MPSSSSNVPTASPSPPKSPANVVALRDLEDAERAFNRVHAELEALDPAEFTTQNVDIVSAASVALGVVPTVLSFRARIAALPEYDIRDVDGLEDFAKAAWFAHITNLPEAEPTDLPELKQEVYGLRSKFLLWAQPLATSGYFAQIAVDKIKEGSGDKDAASDVVALVTLFRSRWDAIQNMCGVTAQDLDRGAQIGPALFSALSRRDNEPNTPSDKALRVRRAWSRLDLAYQQCRRAVTYLHFDEGDVDVLLPNLRRNQGPRHVATPEPAPPAAPQVPAVAVPPAASPASPAPLGGSASPFTR